MTVAGAAERLQKVAVENGRFEKQETFVAGEGDEVGVVRVIGKMCHGRMWRWSGWKGYGFANN